MENLVFLAAATLSASSAAQDKDRFSFAKVATLDILMKHLFKGCLLIEIIELIHIIEYICDFIVTIC